jgi:hypothetical protein
MAVAAAPAGGPGTVRETDSAAAGTAAGTGLATVATASTAALLGWLRTTVVAQAEEPDQPGDE